MDIGARRLGLDPAEIRRRNLVRAGRDAVSPGPHLQGRRGDRLRSRAISPPPFERALALLDYDDWRRRQAAQPKDATRASASASRATRRAPASAPSRAPPCASMPSGKVYVLIGVAAQGQGHATTLAQVCAAGAGRARSRTSSSWRATRRCFPFGMGTGGSRVMVNAGPAVANTAREVRERAALVAAELLECAPDDVRIEASRAFVAGMPDRTVPLGRLAQAAVRSKALKATGEPGLHACTLLLSRHRHVGVRHAGRRGGGRRRDRRRAPARLRGRPRPRPRHQSDDRRGASSRAAPCRASAPGCMEEIVYDERRPAPDRQPHGLRDSARRRPAADSGRAQRAPLGHQLRSASRASARAAPSPAPPPSPTPSRTPSPTSASRSARSR